MQVDNALLDALGAAVNLDILLALPPRQAMEPEQISVLSLDNVLLGRVSPQGAEVGEVGGIANRRRDGY